MKSKTWNIGEYAKGGVITAEIHENNLVKIIGKEWDQSKGWSKNSDQSNAKPFAQNEGNILAFGVENQFDDFLNDLTTAYYADQVLTWIKSNL